MTVYTTWADLCSSGGYLPTPREVEILRELPCRAKDVYAAVIEHLCGLGLGPGDPSFPWLIEMTGVCRKTLKDGLTALELAGLIEVHDNPGRASSYQLSPIDGSRYAAWSDLVNADDYAPTWASVDLDPPGVTLLHCGVRVGTVVIYAMLVLYLKQQKVTSSVLPEAGDVNRIARISGRAYHSAVDELERRGAIVIDRRREPTYISKDPALWTYSVPPLLLLDGTFAEGIRFD